MPRIGRERGIKLGVSALILIACAARAEEPQPVEPPRGPAEIGAPVVPTISPAVRDLPDAIPDPSLFGLEMPPVQRAITRPYEIKRRVDPLVHLQGQPAPRLPDGFGALVHNYAGIQSGGSPPDANLDVGPNHVVQTVNGPGIVVVMDKATGTILKTFLMESLTTVVPCRRGLGDPLVLYDRAADRWILSEIASGASSNTVCVYVSSGPDPTGTWFAYAFKQGDGVFPDYPKLGVWPQTGGGSYLLGINGGDTVSGIAAFDRAKMLAGQPAPFQKFPNLPTPYGPYMMMPATVQGPTPPPDGQPAMFVTMVDDEWIFGADTPATDDLPLAELRVDWQTPANSTMTLLPPITISEFRTPCTETSFCVPQPGAIRLNAIVALFHPLQYRNFGDHQTLVSTFDVDTDGTDHVGPRWFELRKTGASPWGLFQEGTIGSQPNVHRWIGAVAMDGSGNMAIGYSRSGKAVPYYPSIYYRGRLATDPLGTMPQGEFAIWDATDSRTVNPRWGDYAGIGIDPSDDCTFWFTTEYGRYGDTRVAAFKFDTCGCLAVPPSPTVGAAVPASNRIDVTWNDSPAASIVAYRLYRATAAGGPYEQIADVPDASSGVPDGPSYVYHDDTVSGGTHYYYVVKSTDGDECTSGTSNVADAVATGPCTLAPSFGGLAAVTNGGTSTCSLNLAWTPAIAVCPGGVAYDVYRSTAADFVPGPGTLVATGLTTTTFTDPVGLTGGTPYFYIVRAVGGNGVEDVNVVRRSATPTALIPFGWTETFEGSQSGGGFDQAGWTKQTLSGATGWVSSSARAYDGTRSWLAPGDLGYSDKVLVSPPFVVVSGTTLEFRQWYFMEGTVADCRDAGILEYTIDGGATWTAVPPGDFLQGGHNGTVNHTLGNPLGGRRAWCGDSGGAWTPVTLTIGYDPALRNRTLQLRWRQGSDIQNPSFGWWIDTVNLVGAGIESACSVGAGTLTVSNNGPVCEGAPLNLSASYAQAGVAYSWTGPNGFTSSFQNPTIPNSSLATEGTYVVNIYLGPTLVASSSTVASVIPDSGACTDANACTLDDACGGGVCSGAPNVPGTAAGLGFATVTDLSWDPVAGATSYDVVRGTLSTLRGGDFTVEACTAADLAPTSVYDDHAPGADDGDWFLVRGRSACGPGTYDDGSASQAAPRDADITASTNTCP